MFKATRGSTSRIQRVFIQDIAQTTTIAGKTGLTNASGGLLISLIREKAATVDAYSGVNILSITTLGTWADPGAGKVRFKELDATNQPGVYELQFENTPFAVGDGSRNITGYISGTGIPAVPFKIDLDAVDYNSLTAFVTSVEISAASVTAVWAAGTRSLTTFGTLVADIWANATRTLSAFAFSVTVGANNDKTGYTLSSAGIQAIWDALTSALTTVGSAGKLLVDNLNATVSSRSSHAAADIWAVGTRTLTSFGTLVADIWASVADSPGVTTLLSRLSAARAGYLDNLNNIVANIWAAVADSSGVTTLLARLTNTRATNLDNLDAAVSSRSSHSAADTWAVGTRTLTSFGTLVADIWSAGTRSLTTFGTLVSDIWASVTDSSGVTTLLSRLSAARAGYLDTLNGLVANIWASVTDSSGVTTLLSRLTNTRATNLDNLDATSSSIKARTDLIPADPATITNQTTILNRIGAFTGSGLNTILGVLRAMAAKAASLTPTDLSTGTTYNNVTDSLENIKDSASGGGGGSTAADIWAYANRTLTQSAAAVAAAMDGSDLVVTRGISFSASLTGLPDLTNFDKIYFTAKKKYQDEDDESIIQIEITDGLLYLSGVDIDAPDNLWGEIVIDDLALGNVTINLLPTATLALKSATGLKYDMKGIILASETATLLTAARLSVSEVVTEAID